MNIDKRSWYAIPAVVVILVLVYWAARRPAEHQAATTAPALAAGATPAPVTTPAPDPLTVRGAIAGAFQSSLVVGRAR